MPNTALLTDRDDSLVEEIVLLIRWSSAEPLALSVHCVHPEQGLQPALLHERWVIADRTSLTSSHTQRKEFSKGYVNEGRVI